MNIKGILLAGGTIKFPYKEEDKDWIGESVYFIFQEDMV
jgi:hypothetical protein